jgi:hypothetical protein
MSGKHGTAVAECQANAALCHSESERRTKRYGPKLAKQLKKLRLTKVPLSERVIKVDWKTDTRLSRKQLESAATDDDQHHSDDNDETLGAEGGSEGSEDDGTGDEGTGDDAR